MEHIERKKSFGQCFMEDKNILQYEAKILNCEGKSVMEIGAGDGRLSEMVLKQNPRKLFLIEKDKRFVEILRVKFANFDQVEIWEGDVLDIDLPQAQLIIGNIPYNISSQIIFMLPKLQFEQAILMVQEEFARKMIVDAGDSNYGRLSVTAQLHFEIEYLKKVPKHLFRPQPKVDSAIIKLKLSGIELNNIQEDIIRGLFSHKNKTVKNALTNAKLEKNKIERVGEFLQRRVRTLTKEECLKIAERLSENKD